jgi:hypothetical protein
VILAFNGAKRSGKGTAAQLTADLLTERAYATSVQVGFADKLKLAAARALGYSNSQEHCIRLMDVAKEQWAIDIYNVEDRGRGGRGYKTITGRQYLQWFGTEVGRELFGEDFWIDQVLPSTARYDEEDKSDRYDELVQAMYPDVDHVLITDCRFPNEALRVKALNGLIIHIVRPGFEGDGHTSETPLPDNLVDVTIPNDGSIEQLRWRLESQLELWGLIQA